jgi:hypothetical protein
MLRPITENILVYLLYCIAWMFKICFLVIRTSRLCHKANEHLSIFANVINRSIAIAFNIEIALANVCGYERDAHTSGRIKFGISF